MSLIEKNTLSNPHGLEQLQEIYFGHVEDEKNREIIFPVLKALFKDSIEEVRSKPLESYVREKCWGAGDMDKVTISVIEVTIRLFNSLNVQSSDSQLAREGFSLHVPQTVKLKLESDGSVRFPAYDIDGSSCPDNNPYEDGGSWYWSESYFWQEITLDWNRSRESHVDEKRQPVVVAPHWVYVLGLAFGGTPVVRSLDIDKLKVTVMNAKQEIG